MRAVVLLSTEKPLSLENSSVEVVLPYPTEVNSDGCCQPSKAILLFFRNSEMVHHQNQVPIKPLPSLLWRAKRSIQTGYVARHQTGIFR